MERLQEVRDSNMSQIAKKQISEMQEMYFVGVSVGFAYQHPLLGDNTCTTMLGGTKP